MLLELLQIKFMSDSKHELGREGEELAKEFYLKKGYKLVAQNYYLYTSRQSGKIGEIDLIFELSGKIYFVEVKTRSIYSVNKYGQASGQLRRSQLNSFFKTHHKFIKEFPEFKDSKLQYDFVFVQNGNIKVIPNALNFDSFY
ncbi:MAG: YraN family protein [Patescibacteria group bacterium]